MTEEVDEEMNSKVNRLRTFYVNDNINSVNKLKFVEKGLYISQDTGEIICTKCDATFSDRDNGYISVSYYKKKSFFSNFNIFL